MLNKSSGLKSTFQCNSWIGTDYWTQNYGTMLTESNSIQVIMLRDTSHHILCFLMRLQLRRDAFISNCQATS